MIHRNRGNRRFRNYTKAKRKANIIRDTKSRWNYTSLHSLSKGKIHCSCLMCAAKTNGKLQKSRGPVCSLLVKTPLGEVHMRVWGHRISGTHHRYGRKNYCIADQKKIDRLDYCLKEYYRDDEEMAS